jgi:thiol:disulfide interchange protein
MRKSVLVFCLIGFFARSSASAQTWLTGSLDDALAKAKAAGKPVLVDFFAETG